jgi:NAD(P)-dependent dehydrogenase (short-subunit alcohol dehydrogenase family)
MMVVVRATTGAYLHRYRERIREDPEARGRYVAMVRRNTARMSDLVSDLLALTTTEHSEAMAPAEPVAFREIFHTVRERLLDDAEEKGIRIEEDSLPKVAAGTSEEMAAATAFLCSDEAAYITGQTLFVDGGLTLYPDFRTGWSSE